MKPIARVAVVGAGVMGAQLAAHLINQGIPVALYDLPDGSARGRAGQAIDKLDAIKPPPLADKTRAALIRPLSIDDDLAQLATCDLVIEAIGERLDHKVALFARLLPHLHTDAWLVSNTSGLSLGAMAESLPEARRTRFCGLHFFNPPRYMTLVELIVTPWTDETALAPLQSFVTSRLGKNILRAFDTPNFIANRIGVAATVFAFHHAQRLGLPCDLVDDLTGTRIGRPRSATYRTADVVGLDILAHVIDTTYRLAHDDPFHDHFAPDPVVAQLLAAGALGAKNGRGFYRKDGKAILQWDGHDYRATGAQAHPDVVACLEAPPSERLARLRQLNHPEARFLWAIQRDLFHYCACLLDSIAPSAREVDLALRWGFGWNMGPFESWQLSGWQEVARWIEDDRRQGLTLSACPLPDWVSSPDRLGVHGPHGSWSARTQGDVLPEPSAWGKRQRFPVKLAGTDVPVPERAGRTIEASRTARLWTLDNANLILTLTSKMNTLGEEPLKALDQAVNLAERNFRALVIWSPGPHFSAGGDLAGFMQTYTQRGLNGLAESQAFFQQALQRLRSSAVPTVAALKGYALGGGCEMAWHCDRRVAHGETYLGLVEVNVGLFPGAGGLTEIARRAGLHALRAGTPLLVADHLRDDVTRILRCEVSGSAQEALAWGWLEAGDILVPHVDELLHVALNEATAMAEAGYVAALERPFPVAGVEGRAQMLAALTNAHQGGLISDHDLWIGRTLATVVCGADLPAGTLVTAAYMLALEREHFGPLLASASSRERIQSFLETGKAVRN